MRIRETAVLRSLSSPALYAIARLAFVAMCLPCGGCSNVRDEERNDGHRQEFGRMRAEAKLLIGLISDHRAKSGAFPNDGADGQIALQNLLANAGIDSGAVNVHWDYINVASDISSTRIVLASRVSDSDFGKRYCFGIEHDAIVVTPPNQAFSAGDWIDWDCGIAFVDEATYLSWRETHSKSGVVSEVKQTAANNRVHRIVQFTDGVSVAFVADPFGRESQCIWRRHGSAEQIVEYLTLDKAGRVTLLSRSPKAWEPTWHRWHEY